MGRAPDAVPNHLFGENPFVKEFGQTYHLPAAAYLGGRETSEPDFVARLATLTDADALVKMRPSNGPAVTSRAVDPTPRSKRRR